VRLQRFLAEAGIAARRKAEALITEGRVRVNGRTAELGVRVVPGKDRVELDGRPVAREKKAYLLLHKPRGYVSTLSDPDGRPTVMELLPRSGPRLYPVGRLDFNTEGLLLFTNDGELANGLMHPRREVQKTYHVKLRGVLTGSDVERLEGGVELDGAARKARVAGGGKSESGKHSWIELSITEGRNRQIHRMMEAIGHEVSRLVRVGYGPLGITALPRGKWRRLTPDELQQLGELAGVRPPRPEEPARRAPRRPVKKASATRRKSY
jgi:23S rRNA pseudouridine2605 synthase